jgi:hypothetical protein
MDEHGGGVNSAAKGGVNYFDVVRLFPYPSCFACFDALDTRHSHICTRSCRCLWTNTSVITLRKGVRSLANCEQAGAMRS